MADLEDGYLVAANSQRTEKIHVRLMRSNALHAAHALALRNLRSFSNTRSALVANAIVLAAEHHAAICLLVANAHYSTSHALARPLMETTMRAVWLSYVAGWDKVEIVANRQSSPDLDSICGYIKNNKNPTLVPIAEAVLSNKGVFHSFAHASGEQLIRRVRGYSEKEVMTLLMMADTFACIAIANAAELYDDPSLRKMATYYGFPIGMESHYEYGAPRPSADWDGRLPVYPAWNDPE